MQHTLVEGEQSYHYTICLVIMNLFLVALAFFFVIFQQANQTGNSNAMELEGAKRCFLFLQSVGLSVITFVSDRHRGIAKWLKTSQPQTTHYFDIWHVARSINKKLLKASQEKGCEVIKDWMRGVKNHLYWCVTSTLDGFEKLILAKWKSFLGHIRNKHTGHPDSDFEACAHEEIAPRRWIKSRYVVYPLKVYFSLQVVVNS